MKNYVFGYVDFRVRINFWFMDMDLGVIDCRLEVEDVSTNEIS